ncbi:Tat (Twin-arginine translocation) pathway signal sequence [Acidipropionibacterium acidipropionici ATCC 4875]|uniref:Tat (Twin-arginine translocation) pathway signal sequence n=1 Tax=Acidipropionibacterium acidipropionici (strain ATCC 4875 / DSM 20272 / JCM 6432 / NBRC 12425 / NCIMB 8070 / 4) TaxID=1171373 RepID=K7RQE5_ACIA4|nr:DUF6350 family protein [Acidipropionibacterium acidipropionici]AFV90244.1 Tat (Twin-arginine translocation) pathway signal sequence [Acidipropionibacterium acidipropionici ATCC 4875]
MPSSHRSRGRGSASDSLDERVDLSVASSARPRGRAVQPRWPWPVVTVLGCLLGVGGVWVVLTGILAPEWLALKNGRFSDLTGGATRLWLLAHGVPITGLGLHLGLAPLGLTVIIVLVGEQTCRFGARVMSAGRRAAGRVPSWRAAGQVAAVHASTHLVLVILLCGSVGAAPWPGGLVGGLAAGVIAGLVGAVRGARLDPAELVPPVLRGIPLAAGAGVAVVLAGGAIVLAVALLMHGERVIALHEGLAPGPWGGFVLFLVELAWLPDLLMWAASWALGSGFAVGIGSSVSPFGVHLGMIPSIPVLAALPDPGTPMIVARLWMILPVIAGAVAGVLVLRDRAGAGIGASVGYGAAAGAASGLLVALVGALSGGAVGSGRLAQTGALMPQTLGLAVGLLGIGGALSSLVVALIRRHRNASGTPQTPEGGEERRTGGSHRVSRKRSWEDEAGEETRPVR